MNIKGNRMRLVFFVGTVGVFTLFGFFAAHPTLSKQTNSSEVREPKAIKTEVSRKAAPNSTKDSSANTNEQVLSMKLLANGVGWVMTQTQLLLTTTAGKEWKDITPPVRGAQPVNAFFLDPLNGFAVLSIAYPGNTFSSLVVASTSDGGESWTLTEPLTASDYKQYEFSRQVAIQFVDPTHGWIMIKRASSSNFSQGLLLKSSDGGHTWQELPEPPIGDSIYFTTDKLGWLAGGADGGRLFNTVDGGVSWSEVALEAPDGLKESLQRAVDLPTFLNKEEGILPLTFSGSEQTTVVFYETVDAGKSWSVKRAVTLANRTAVGNKIATSIFGPDSFVVGSQLSVTILAGGKTLKKGAAMSANNLSAKEIRVGARRKS